MKITNDYIVLKNQINKFFTNYKPKERIKHKDKIVKLQKDINAFESKIINGILSYSLDYDRVHDNLSKKDFHHFLKENVEIGRFLMNRSISSSIGFNEEKRNEIILNFKKLCEEAWEDYIITKDERATLNEYCKENYIDKTQQFIIEHEVSSRYNDGFDLVKIVNHYYLIENLNNKEIQRILIKEYKKEVELRRISTITDKLGDKLIDEFDVESGKSRLIKTLKWNDQISIYIIVVNGNLSSGFDFEIGFKENETDSWKVIISKTVFDKSNRTRIIDIITDGICYQVNSKQGGDMFQLKFFLEMKSNVRTRVEELY